MQITQPQLETYLRNGFVIIPNFLKQEELSAAHQNMLQYFPTAEELQATPDRYPHIIEDPEHLQIEFPFAGHELNKITTHPNLISFVQTVLGTNDILLSQSAIWAKYANTGDFEQGLHLDYQGNTLVVPRDDNDYRQVNMILYYTEVTEELGPTYVVSQQKTADLPLWPTHRTRKRNPDLYAHERPVLANPGDLFIFSMRTWHRASAITADFGVRFSHHLVFRSAHHNFQGYHHWPSKGENEQLQSFITHATPQQRELLGFPKPTDPYWTQETRAAVKLRYPEMDMRPYE